MKKLLILASALLMATTVNAQSDIKIMINGAEFENQTEAVVENDRVLVPMREIFEALGATISWDGEKRQVNAQKEADNLVFTIGENMLYKNGEAKEMGTEAIIKNDRTLVPVRAVSESFGAQVGWDGENRTVTIITEEKSDVIPVVIEMNNGGVMKAELYPEVAPITVANFVKLANEGFYDGLIFHRVIEGFMIQGGGYDENFSERETEEIKGEFELNGVENNLKHERGVLSMARTMIPDSATSQFFIMHEAAPHLDGSYAAFGKLTEGFEVLDEIAACETVRLTNGMADVPAEMIVIKTIRVEE